VLVVIGVIAAAALPRLLNLGSDSRATSIQALGGSVRNSLNLANSVSHVRGLGSAGSQANITWMTLDGVTQVRMWSGYPDRWCDGVGILQNGMTVPSAGCYLSAAPVVSDAYTFYGYGNSQIPNGNAGWRIESAPGPMQCSVEYAYNGSGVPVVTIFTSGC
jgi:MSHA pilin protein MshA